MKALAKIILISVLFCFSCFASNSKINHLDKVETGVISRHLEYCRKCDEQLKYSEFFPCWEAVNEREDEDEKILSLAPKEKVSKKIPALCVILYGQNSGEPKILAVENMESYSLFFMENNIFRSYGLPYFKAVEGEKCKNFETKTDVVQQKIKKSAKRCKGNLKRKREENEESEDADTRCSSQASGKESDAEPSTVPRKGINKANRKSEVVYKVKGVTHEPRNTKQPYRTRITHKSQIVHEGVFKTKGEAEDAAKRVYIKLKKNPFAVLTKKNKQPKESKVFPKSNVKGVQFMKSSTTYPWIFTFQRNKKSIYKSFKTQEEAENAAFALHKALGIVQEESDVRGVIFSKDPRLKRHWEARVIIKNKIVYHKRHKTKEEAEEDSKLEHELRNISWRKKQVSKN